jgi:redox-sensitive bicupin YhaK (pirin superfamily)
MNYRKAKIYNEIQHFNVGPFQVKQPLPASNLEQVSPFILLHHAGPDTHAAGSLKDRLSPHPHRGFEPVTFLFSGKMHHKDSSGGEGFLQAGDVQWMTAGSGIIHSEGPSETFAKEGGTIELIQLWVNLPRDHKMTPPKYQDIKKDSIPEWKENGFEFRLVAGNYAGKQGPASTFTPILAMMVNFEAGSESSIQLPEAYNALVYVLDGSIESDGKTVKGLNMAVYDHNGEGISLKATSAGRLLLLAGEPINEPVSSYGPFVMNYPGEIRQAIMDYELGKMGVLES